MFGWMVVNIENGKERGLLRNLVTGTMQGDQGEGFEAFRSKGHPKTKNISLGPSHVLFQILGFRKNRDFAHFYGFQGAFMGISDARGRLKSIYFD